MTFNRNERFKEYLKRSQDKDQPCKKMFARVIEEINKNLRETDRDWQTQDDRQIAFAAVCL